MSFTKAKPCARCKALLPLTDFALAISSHCKACTQPKRTETEAPKPRPTELILNAIRQGASTQAQMSRLTKLGEQQVSEAIRRLMLDSRQVGCKVVGDENEYFVKVAA